MISQQYLDTIKRKVEAIKELAYDQEVAHGLEDNTRALALSYIASNSTDDKARELALEALKTEAIRFDRWCA